MIPQLLTRFAVNSQCSGGDFLSFPKWYAYLQLNADCSPKIVGLSDVWLIVAAVVEILLRLAAIIAVVIIIWGGVDFITSQGDPDKASKARGTIVNALIGLGISVGAAAVITFLAGSFTK